MNVEGKCPVNQLLAVACGGALGALLRYLLQTSLVYQGKFPMAIFIANVVGSFAMGVMFVMLQDKSLVAEWLRPFLMVGLLGAFTTFSTFSLDTIRLLEAGQVITALSNVLLSVIVAIGAAYAGVMLARMLSQ
ncbi:MAG TPA: fluoride efflux transporter CrcB [Oceanospirillaceae bacterium]|nr:fluoride efflux transporter CrcB [Oceanospirillaceae bacterium]